MLDLLKKVFGTKKKSELPPIYGGDATSIEKAVVINCAASTTANHLIDRFISERHGKKGIDWKRDVEFLVKDKDPNEMILAIGITIKAGKATYYFFNLTRPMNATVLLVKQITKDIETKL